MFWRLSCSGPSHHYYTKKKELKSKRDEWGRKEEGIKKTERVPSEEKCRFVLRRRAVM